ncbi:hypothetical protein AB4Y44_13515 [Paraburkholderia sp. BR10937]|uniref:hypothetical protein n=1 Tax=Paraburkholderia sp. BR10937 TaxID=3236994 RepID=UPI0034D348C1
MKKIRVPSLAMTESAAWREAVCVCPLPTVASAMATAGAAIAATAAPAPAVNTYRRSDEWFALDVATISPFFQDDG